PAPEQEEEGEEEAVASRGANPFDDEDMTIGAEPTRPKARYGEGEAAKRPTAPRPPPARVRSSSVASLVEDPTPGGDEPPEGGEAPEMAELESANRELQRLLDRR